MQWIGVEYINVICQKNQQDMKENFLVGTDPFKLWFINVATIRCGIYQIVKMPDLLSSDLSVCVHLSRWLHIGQGNRVCDYQFVCKITENIFSLSGKSK